MRVIDHVLNDAGRMESHELRSLDAIQLASARLLGAAIKVIITYDERWADAAQASGWSVASPH